MGMPVNTVATGGLAIVESTSGFGAPVSEAAPGRGVAVTKIVGGLGLPVIFDTIGITPPLILATFDGTPSAGVVMSNGNLTVTHGNTSNGSGNASTMTKSTGKYYFECKLDVVTGLANGAGIKTYAAGAFLEGTGTFPNGFGISLGAVSKIYTNNTDSGKDLGGQAAGDIYGFAIDLGGRLGWIRKGNGLWNADAAANPVTGTNGIAITAGAMSPMVRFTAGGATTAFTANFGATAYANAAPSGFGNWGV